MTKLALLVLALVLVGCGGGGVNVEALSPTPPTLMVATKLKTPLYIVLDPGRVKPAYEVERIGTITNMSTFVSRDVKRAMGEYFATVEIVPNEAAITVERYVIADVKVDGFKKGSVSDGQTSYSVFEMTWSLALRPSDSKDYWFSFAGISPSNYMEKSWKGAVNTMLEGALTGLLKGWAEARAFGDLQDWEG